MTTNLFRVFLMGRCEVRDARNAWVFLLILVARYAFRVVRIKLTNPY